MLTIKTPEEYRCERDILKQVGEFVSRYGRRAFIISGETAWKAVEDVLSASLEKWKIDFKVHIMKGYPTYDKVVRYASESVDEQADLVIGVGGGRVCDVAKGTANHRNLPAVMIPTVAATCACWAARSILYTDDGDFDRILWNEHNPNMILADTKVLAKAPKRFLAAGILDTQAKWYEFEPLIDSDPGDVVLRQDVAISKLAFDILEELGAKAMTDTSTEEEFRQVLDSVFFLAGASGSFANGKAYRGFAHSYYYATTRIPESRHRLHGEKVAFGLLVQFVLKEKREVFLDHYLDELLSYGITDIPEDWNTRDTEDTEKKIAELILKESPIVVEKKFVSNSIDCADAIHKASGLLRSKRNDYGKQYV